MVALSKDGIELLTRLTLDKPQSCEVRLSVAYTIVNLQDAGREGTTASQSTQGLIREDIPVRFELDEL